MRHRTLIRLRNRVAYPALSVLAAVVFAIASPWLLTLSLIKEIRRDDARTHS